MKRLALLAMLMAALGASAQLGSSTARHIVGGTKPATCSAGPPADVWVDTTVTPPILNVCGPANTWNASGAGTVTHTGNLTLNHLMLGAGSADSKVDSAIVSDGAGAISGAASLMVAAGGFVGSADVGTPKFTFSTNLITANQPLNVPSFSSGTAPTACGSATGCIAMTAADVAGSNVAGQYYIRAAATGTKLITNYASGEGPFNVASGGTGLATLTAHALYVGNSASAPAAVSVPAADSLLYGTTAADPSFKALPTTGTNGCAGATDMLQFNTATHAFACGTAGGGASVAVDTTQFTTAVASPTSNKPFLYGLIGGACGTDCYSVEPVAASLKNFYAVPATAVGGSGTITLVLQKSGVGACGSPGAVTITLQASDAAYTVRSDTTNTCTVSPGDKLEWYLTNNSGSNSPQIILRNGRQ